MGLLSIVQRGKFLDNLTFERSSEWRDIWEKQVQMFWADSPSGLPGESQGDNGQSEAFKHKLDQTFPLLKPQMGPRVIWNKNLTNMIWASLCSDFIFCWSPYHSLWYGHTGFLAMPVSSTPTSGLLHGLSSTWNDLLWDIHIASCLTASSLCFSSPGKLTLTSLFSIVAHSLQCSHHLPVFISLICSTFFLLL